MARVRMVRWTWAVLAGLCALATCEVQQQCPPRPEIAPCTCQVKKNGLDVLCELTDQQHINDAMGGLKGKSLIIFYLKLRHNNLKKLPGFVFLGLDIRHLTIHNSSLSVVEEASLSSIGKMLTQLDVSQNSLTQVPSPAIKNLHHLLILNMNHNKISSLHARAFEGLDTLEILTLYENKISNIDPEAFVGLEKKLKRLNLGGNGLNTVPQKSLAILDTLKKLEMQENAISEIREGDFEGLKNLDSLGLAHNKLKTVPPRVFSHLTLLNSLELEGNKIDKIDAEAFAGLEENLQYLRMGDNKIRAIPTEALKRLHRLRHLDLRSNNISHIAEDAFTGFGDSITFLNLQKNDIRSLSGLVFENLNSLETLNLQNNKLMHVSEDVMEPILDTLRVVDIMDNPLVCDCELQWYKTWLSTLKEKDDEMMQKKRTVCTIQQEHREYSLQSLPLEKMKCVIKSADVGQYSSSNNNRVGFLAQTAISICILVRYIKLALLWLRRWNKVLAVLIAFLFFSSMLAIVTVEISNESEQGTVKDERETIWEEPVIDLDRNLDNTNINNCELELGTVCTVLCSNIVDVNVSSVVNNMNLASCSSTEINLNLDAIFFTNNTIVYGWLDTLSINVEELTISSVLLGDIQESAFAGKPFEYLRKLVITDSRIKVLKQHSFLNSKIQDFEFRQSGGIITIEKNALEPISDYLTILQFSECIDDFQSINNITGTGVSLFNKLSEIDLRFNTFKTVLNYSFIDTPNLVALYLSENNIKSIEVNAFKGIQNSIHMLNLRNNKLSTLPDGVFQGFKGVGEININDNPWNCTCELLWFKEFYIHNFENYFRNGTIPFTCTAGIYTDVDFCPEISTTISYEATTNNNATITSNFPNSTIESTATPTIGEITSTKRSTTAPTENPLDYVYLNCTDISIYKDTSLEGLNKIFSHSVKVRNGTVTYNFYQIEDSPNFEIKVLNRVGNDYLIWINSENSSDYGCVNNIQETVQLNNLQYGNSYTLCLLKEAAEMVAPFDCTSLTVPLEWEDNPWILNKHIPTVVGAVIGITLAVILITTLIIFYTIRQNPKLIKGNKRVVIVRNKSADALVLPKYEKQQYILPSVYTNSEGYLTPRNKTYEQINERRFRHLNTITEKFYNDLRDSSSKSIESTYANFPHRRSVGSEVYEPPPLPPNHPSERIKIFPVVKSRQSSIYKH